MRLAELDEAAGEGCQAAATDDPLGERSEDELTLLTVDDADLLRRPIVQEVALSLVVVDAERLCELRAVARGFRGSGTIGTGQH